MQLIATKFYESHPGQFSISILGQEMYRTWIEQLFSFKYENGKVYFLTGGQEKDKN